MTMRLAISALLLAGTCFGAPKRLALLVGIDRYRSVSIPRLNGCVNDVQGFRDLLIRKFGFADSDIVLLTNEQAGRDAILKAFRSSLIDKASDADEVVFYYAGHGSTAPDVTRASEQAQTIVPWDSRDAAGKVFDITDRELRGLFGELKQKTKNITAILDSCHSGTAVRGATQRSIPGDTRPQPRSALQRGASQGPEDRGIVFIAGSRSDRVSFEHFAEGSGHGAMSWFLARELNAAGPDSTWRDVMDRVRGEVSARFPFQEPQLEGAAADKRIFGGVGEAGPAYYLVSPRVNATVRLKAGSIQAVAAGSVFDVYPPGTKDFNATTIIASIEITRAESFGSEARIVSGGPIPEAARAIERLRRYGDFRFSVYWQDPGVKVFAAVRDTLTKDALFEMTDDPARADLVVRLEKDGIVTASSDGMPLSPAMDPAAPDAGLRLTERIRNWAKWYQLLKLESPSPQPLVSLRVEALTPRRDGRIFTGDRLRVAIANHSQRPLFVALLDLSRTGSVDVLPLTVEGASEQVAPSREIIREIEAYVPDGQTSATDFLKVFASVEAIDFRMLTMGNIREAPAKDPLTQLFAAALTGIRGVRPVSVVDWGTATRRIVVERP